MKRLNILNCLMKFFQGSIFFYPALLLKELHFGGWEIGILLSIYSLTPLLFSIPAGVLNDRVNSRFLITLALAGYSLFYCGLIFFKSFHGLIAVFIIGGASANFFNVSVQALALKFVDDRERGRSLGFFQGMAYLSYALGLVGGGFMMTSHQLVALLALSAAANLFLAVYALFLGSSTLVSINMLEYLQDFRRPRVLIFCLVYSVFAIHWGSEASTLFLFLEGHFGFTKFQSGLYMLAPLIVLTITTIMAGKVMDRNHIDTWKIMETGFFASGLGMILMVNHNVYLSASMRMVHEFGDGIAAVAFLVGLSRLFRSDRIGGLSSAATFTNIIASSMGALIFSKVGEVTSYSVPVICAGISALLASFLLYRFRASF
ncbi:MAG: MFS transporter [Candidatus Eremiobacteraeota bacterium]|nr:MFS transporter [Candidatus Eremiobacteraeota bacterium]